MGIRHLLERLLRRQHASAATGAPRPCERGDGFVRRRARCCFILDDSELSRNQIWVRATGSSTYRRGSSARAVSSAPRRLVDDAPSRRRRAVSSAPRRLVGNSCQLMTLTYERQSKYPASFEFLGLDDLDYLYFDVYIHERPFGRRGERDHGLRTGRRNLHNGRIFWRLV